MNEAELSTILSQVKKIAVVGASNKPDRPVFRVGTYLIKNGFTVVPVHPKQKEIWGLTTYQTLLDIEHPVDCVNIFRAPKWIPEHARECASLKVLPRVFWMQSGLFCPEAFKIFNGLPITIVQDRCIMVDHSHIMGATNDR